MVESCRDDFVMVAGGATFDQDGVDTRLECLLPDFAGFVTSPKARGADLARAAAARTRSASCRSGSSTTSAGSTRTRTDHVGVLTGDIATTKIVAADNATAAKSLGWKISYNDVYPVIGMSRLDAVRAEAEGHRHEGAHLGRRAGGSRRADGRAARHRVQARLHPCRRQPLRPQAHRHRRLRARRPQRVREQRVLPVRAGEADERDRASTSRLFEQYKPGGKSRTYLGLQAWSAWLLFAKAAGTCGNDLTRTCVYDAAKKITVVDRWRPARRDVARHHRGDAVLRARAGHARRASSS